MRTAAELRRSHTNRGKWLETAMISAFTLYEHRMQACVDKIEVPIIRLPGGGFRPVLSTVDFTGHIMGIPVRMEAKLVHERRIRASAVRTHQMLQLKRYERTGALGVIVVCFEERASYMVTPEWWERALERDELGALLVKPAKGIGIGRFARGGLGCAQIRHGAGVTMNLLDPAVELWRQTDKATQARRLTA